MKLGSICAFHEAEHNYPDDFRVILEMDKFKMFSCLQVLDAAGNSDMVMQNIERISTKAKKLNGEFFAYEYKTA